MKAVSRALRNLVLVLCFLGVIYAIVANYSFVFSKAVRGEVMEVERVIQPTTMIGSSMTAEQMFSYAVLVRAESGEIFSSSSTDRQWAIVRKGFCVETRLYPYPPWDMEKADTYFNARLVKVLPDCKRIGGFAGETPAPGSALPAPAATVPPPGVGAVAPNGTAAPNGSGSTPPSAPASSPATTGSQPPGLPGTRPNAQPALPHGMSN